MERCQWTDWEGWPESPDGQRVYLGEETCGELLPVPARAAETVGRLYSRGVSVTLVTPPAGEPMLERILRLVAAVEVEGGPVEVVCNDWGVLRDVARSTLCIPVVGRLLAGQSVDPRLARLFEAADDLVQQRPVEHLDGTVCRLRRRLPGRHLAEHLQRCSLDRAGIRRHLAGMGVSRCEVSALPQGIVLGGSTEWTFTVHGTAIPVAVLPRCPGPGEDFLAPPPCGSAPDCAQCHVWTAPGFPVSLVRRGNCLYAPCAPLPPVLPASVDRVVVDARMPWPRR